MAIQPSPVIHDRSFGRFDEILYFVENASALTLARRRRVRRARALPALRISVETPFIGDVIVAKRTLGRTRRS